MGLRERLPEILPMLVVEKERCRYEEILCVLSRYLCGLDRSIRGWHSELNQKLLLLYNDS